MPFRRVSRDPKPVLPAPQSIMDPVDPFSAPDNATPQYAVGYGRPPKHSQFRKGQSGNPKGRIPQSKGILTMVRQMTTEKVCVRTAHGDKRMPRIQAALLKLQEKAFGGDLRALQQLLQLYREAVPDLALPVDTASTPTPASDQALIAEFLEMHLNPSGGGDDG